MVSEGQTEGPEGVKLSLLDTSSKQTLQTVTSGVGGRLVLGLLHILGTHVNLFISAYISLA